MKYELKSLTTGELFGSAFNLYLNNFIVLFIIAFLAGLVDLLGPRVQEAAYSMRLSGTLSVYAGAYMMRLVKLIPDVIATGLITLIVSRRFLDKEFTAGEIGGRAVRLLIPLFLLSILQGLAIAGGFLLLVIPGIIFAVAFQFSNSVMVIEKLGVIQSMKRSWNLTKGARLWIFGVSILIGLIVIAWVFLTNKLSVLIIKKLLLHSPFIVRALPQLFFNALIGPFSYCIYILMYFSVRIKKEGFAVEHLADTFSLDYEVEE